MKCRLFNPILRKWFFAKILRPEGHNPTTGKTAYSFLIMYAGWASPTLAKRRLAHLRMQKGFQAPGKISPKEKFD